MPIIANYMSENRGREFSPSIKADQIFPVFIALLYGTSHISLYTVALIFPVMLVLFSSLSVTVLLGFVHKPVAKFVIIPEPVTGASLIYASCCMIIAGFRLICVKPQGLAGLNLFFTVFSSKGDESKAKPPVARRRYGR